MIGTHFGLIADLVLSDGGLSEIPSATALASRGGHRPIGSATSLSPELARFRAQCEGLEREAASDRVHIVKVAGADELLGARTDCFYLYEPEQLCEPDFPWTAFDPRTPLAWIAAKRWTSEEEGYLPAAVATTISPLDEPIFRARRGTGIAAANSLPGACRRALLELAERDLATRAWYERDVCPLDSHWWAPVFRERLRKQGLDLKLWSCRNVLRLPVVVAWVGEGEAGPGALGVAARLVTADAADHSVEEAIQMYVRRQGRKALMPFPRDLAHYSVKDVTDTGEEGATISDLVKHYDPWWTDLTTRATAGAGLCVAGAVSAKAIDFLGPSCPIPRLVWRPSREAVGRLRSEPAAFFDEA